MTHSPDANGPLGRGGINDATTLGDLDIIAGREAPSRLARRLHEIAPALGIDRTRGLGQMVPERASSRSRIACSRAASVALTRRRRQASEQ
jgi:hypothetical protein